MVIVGWISLWSILNLKSECIKYHKPFKVGAYTCNILIFCRHFCDLEFQSYSEVWNYIAYFSREHIWVINTREFCVKFSSILFRYQWYTIRVSSLEPPLGVHHASKDGLFVVSPCNFAWRPRPFHQWRHWIYFQFSTENPS